MKQKNNYEKTLLFGIIVLISAATCKKDGQTEAPPAPPVVYVPDSLGCVILTPSDSSVIHKNGMIHITGQVRHKAMYGYNLLIYDTASAKYAEHHTNISAGLTNIDFIWNDTVNADIPITVFLEVFEAGGGAFHRDTSIILLNKI